MPVSTAAPGSLNHVAIVGAFVLALPDPILAQPMTPARLAASAAPQIYPPDVAPSEPSRAQPGDGPSCYANCDLSTNSPILNPNDFSCFLNAFVNSDPYANCDGSSNPPIFNVADVHMFRQGVCPRLPITTSLQTR